MRGQQLHPSRAAPSKPQSGFLGRRRRRRLAHFLAEASVQVQYLDKVVDVPAVSQLQYVGKVVAVPVVLVVRSPAPVVETVVSHSCRSLRMRLPPSLFFDKVVDMPVVAQLARCQDGDLPVVQVVQFSRSPLWRRQSYRTVAER